MKCPACGHENSNAAAQCTSCNHLLNTSKAPSPPVTVRISRLAVVSFLSAILTPPGAMFLAMAYAFIGGFVNLGTGEDLGTAPLSVIFFACVALLVVAFLLGLVSLVRIGTSGGQLTGRGFAVTGTVVPLVLALLLLGIWLQEVRRYKDYIPLRCGANLSQIGKAMLIYANDYDDTLPLAGGNGTVWGPGLNDWAAAGKTKAFGLDPNGSGGEATINSSFYLLVKYGEVPLKSFVCRGDRQTKEFKPRKYGVSDDKLTALWDFGPDPSKHCSYARHLPYGKYPLTISSEPGVAVAADRNPWIDGPREKAGDFSLFRPDYGPFEGTAEQSQHGNARAHENKGQNVLLLDSHVEFTKRPYCGLDDDNIYTAWDGDDRLRGAPPRPYKSQPANEFDSLLVNDPPRPR